MSSAGIAAEWEAALSAEARLHARRVQDHLRRAIAERGGRITFEQFMGIALNAPGLGYYAAGTRKFGEAGDFVTAPELSDLFARCIARFCCALAAEVGEWEILEIGAGSGRLAHDLIGALSETRCAPRRYRILEPSADLRERQGAMLDGAPVPVRWEDGLPERPIRGLILASEVLDAIPVRRFLLEAGRAREWYVAWSDQGFCWQSAPPADQVFEEELERVLGALPAALPNGYVSEIAPARRAWVRSVVDSLERGAVLLADYGYPRGEYYHPQRTLGTLACHHRHRRHDDPLVLPGLQDISVHVEFSAIAEAARAEGAALSGFTTQAQFLLENGVLEECARRGAPGTGAYRAAVSAVRTLTLPGQMGEAVKMMLLTRATERPLPGFGARDLRGRL